VTDHERRAVPSPSATSLDATLALLQPYSPFYVGVEASEHTLRERATTQPSRDLAWALRQRVDINRHVPLDMSVDTDSGSPTAAATAIITAHRDR
jgi:chloramphenicol 3-O-phosphotransferase